MPQVFCCKKLLLSKFCPECGKSFNIAQVEALDPYPVSFITSLHGEGSEDESRESLVQSLGLVRNSDAAEDILKCDYEVNIVWRKDNKSLPPIPVSVEIGKFKYNLSLNTVTPE